MSNNPAAAVPHENCNICSTLKDVEYAFQKYGAEENNTHLPAAVGHLEVVHNFRPYGSRKLQLLQCPGCGTWYLYRTDYEYLVNGSEDEQYLTRLAPSQAAEYLGPSPPG